MLLFLQHPLTRHSVPVIWSILWSITSIRCPVACCVPLHSSSRSLPKQLPCLPNSRVCLRCVALGGEARVFGWGRLFDRDLDNMVVGRGVLTKEVQLREQEVVRVRFVNSWFPLLSQPSACIYFCVVIHYQHYLLRAKKSSPSSRSRTNRSWSQWRARNRGFGNGCGTKAWRRTGSVPELELHLAQQGVVKTCSILLQPSVWPFGVTNTLLAFPFPCVGP